MIKERKEKRVAKNQCIKSNKNHPNIGAIFQKSLLRQSK